tara:strand:+ start:7865 stop:8965 length:1101 start_codon:yes stop_codon:yes gene_type:complete
MSLPIAIINMSYLKHNLNYLQSLSEKSELYPVIKANAYGHGFVEIAKEINKTNIKGVCIATINELHKLINLKLDYSILHLGQISFSDLSLYENDNVIATINSMDDLNKISLFYKSTKALRVHIKIDTGMTRMGCIIDEFNDIFKKCINMKNIRLEGIYSHLAYSDNINEKSNRDQIHLFDNIVHKVRKKNIQNIKFHILNSGGLLNYGDYKYDLIRTGICMYGISPLGIHNDNLKPVMEFKAPVILKKYIKRGTMVGYANSFKAVSDMEVAIIQCGYGDGVPFEYSNTGFVYFDNSKIPIIGRVSMDLISVDISSVNIKVNDYVTLWGSTLDPNSRLEYIAKSFNNIPYTFITGITERVEKRYIYE